MREIAESEEKILREHRELGKDEGCKEQDGVICSKRLKVFSSWGSEREED